MIMGFQSYPFIQAFQGLTRLAYVYALAVGLGKAYIAYISNMVLIEENAERGKQL